MPAVSLNISDIHPNKVSESVKIAMEKGIRSIDSTGNSNNEKMVGIFIRRLLEQQLIRSQYEFFYALHIYGPNLEQEEITTKLHKSLSNFKIQYVNLVIVHTATTNFSVAEILAILRCHVGHQSISVGVMVWDSNDKARSAAEGTVTNDENSITLRALMPYETEPAEAAYHDFQELGETEERNTKKELPICILHNKDLEIVKPVGGVVNFHSQTLKREVYRHHFEEFQADFRRMSHMEFAQLDFTHIGLPGYSLNNDESCPNARTSAEEVDAQVGPIINEALHSVRSVDVEAREIVEQIDDDAQQLIEREFIGNKVMKEVAVLGLMIFFIIIFVVISILPNYI
ncbi:hypothetical protein CAEBREN_23852 [Caenorhabditis brenneri]|uniref:NADP-dependent oxidoreductase domain-containing protein n=1 Tax=Caenorhabditis brenneri TaxID=135651 RepID=G0N4Y3_CAEBE|nr:hypothetical protein CAEBREN_23852 [Caenorhabditis brenneri]